MADLEWLPNQLALPDRGQVQRELPTPLLRSPLPLLWKLGGGETVGPPIIMVFSGYPQMQKKYHFLCAL